MNITIKNTEPCEAEALVRIQKAAFMPLYEKYRDEGSPALRGVEELLSRMTPDYRVFTILCDGEIVGGVFYRLHGKYTPENFLGEGEYYLCRIWIDPAQQSKGIAAAAILLCEREFPDARRFFVDFPIDMEKNKRCYQKVGFCDTGERRPGGERLTLALYKKEVICNQLQSPALPVIYPVKADDLPACLQVIHQSFATVAKARVKDLGGSTIAIGIINESTVLKEWYAANGFVYTGSRKFDHLPFTTGYMAYNVGKEPTQ